MNNKLKGITLSLITIIVLFAINSCQVYNESGDLLYDYKENYVYEAPETDPPVTAEDIKNRVAILDNGDLMILADGDGQIWLKGGYILSYYGYPDWTKTPNGAPMSVIGTYAGKNVYAFRIPAEDIAVLVGEVSDTDCINQYGTSRGCFAFKFAKDDKWTGQFACESGSPYHLRGSSSVYINCAVDFNKPDSDHPYSPN